MYTPETPRYGYDQDEGFFVDMSKPDPNGLGEEMTVNDVVAALNEKRARETELLEALKGLVDVAFRPEGCNRPGCAVCLDNKARMDAAHAAIKKVEGA